MKAFTDLEQGRKLTEILPIESADMYWWFASANNTNKRYYYIEAMDDADFNEEEGHIRAWSLVALLGVLPYPYIEENYRGKWTCKVEQENTTYLYEADNPIDACYEMIVELNKHNLI